MDDGYEVAETGQASSGSAKEELGTTGKASGSAQPPDKRRKAPHNFESSSNYELSICRGVRVPKSDTQSKIESICSWFDDQYSCSWFDDQ